MKLSTLKNAIVKHSPEILTTIGVVGTIVSAVLACKATLQLDDILETHNKDVERIHEAETSEKLPEYDHKKAASEITVVYIKTVGKLIKLYAPSVILGVTSLSMVVKGHDILKKRNAALSAAYATVSKSYKEYRERFKSQFDDPAEADRKDAELRHGIEHDQDEKTSYGTAKAKLPVFGDALSDYAVVFDQSNPNWEGAGSRYFLNRSQCYANDMLRINGRLFLNDVYKILGFKPTQAGQVVGWVWDPENPDHVGDSMVEFDVREVYLKDTQNPDCYEEEPVFLIDFNVDGDVWSNWRAK